MSSIYKIKEQLSELTDTEKRIGEYILNNKDAVVNFSSQKLADEVGASAAAVVRFSKRLGFKGFTHLKVEIAKDTSELEEVSVDQFINMEDSIEVLVKKAHFANARTLESTYRLIQPYILEAAIDVLANAERIYLIGAGASLLVAMDLRQKLSRINKTVVLFENYHDFLGSLSHITKDDVLIAYSYTGETREILYAVEVAKSHKTPIVAITQSSRNSLSKISDYVLMVPKEEMDLRIGSISSRFSMHAISDLLYMGVAKHQIEDARDRLKDTRGIAKGFVDFDK